MKKYTSLFKESAHIYPRDRKSGYFDIGDDFEVVGFVRDKNGNKRIQFFPPKSKNRAVSFQTNGKNVIHNLSNKTIRRDGFPEVAAQAVKDYFNRYMKRA